MGNQRVLLLLLFGIFSVSGQNQLTIYPKGEEQSVFQGNAFFVACSSEADNVQRVMWTGPEGKQITDYQGRIHVEDGRAGHKGVDLVFDEVTRKDRGRYTCSANVDGVEVEKSFELFVHKHIDFKDTPTVQYLDEGEESVLRCDVDGDPTPRIRWSAQGRKVEYGPKYAQGMENPSDLIVKNVTLEDAGLYQCTATQASERTSDYKDLHIEVKVHHMPQWTEAFTDQAYSYVSGAVNLTCEAVAEPHANFTWMKDGQMVMPSDTVQIINEEQKSILMLSVSNDSMFGDYLCIAENRLGVLERVIFLEKGKKPAVPKLEVSGSEVNALILDLSANNHADMQILAYRVQYKMAGDDWSTAKAKVFRKGDKYVINSLEGDTLYVMRASAKNIAGFSDYTTEKMERTKKSHQKGGLVSSSNTLASTCSVVTSLILFFVALL